MDPFRNTHSPFLSTIASRPEPASGRLSLDMPHRALCLLQAPVTKKPDRDRMDELKNPTLPTIQTPPITLRQKPMCELETQVKEEARQRQISDKAYEESQGALVQACQRAGRPMITADEFHALRMVPLRKTSPTA